MKISLFGAQIKWRTSVMNVSFFFLLKTKCANSVWSHVYEEFRVIRLIKTEEVAAGAGAGGGARVSVLWGGHPTGRVLQVGAPSGGCVWMGFVPMNWALKMVKTARSRLCAFYHNTKRKQNKSQTCVICWSKDCNHEPYSSSQPAWHLFLWKSTFPLKTLIFYGIFMHRRHR